MAKSKSPSHYLAVEKSDWSAILQARKKGVAWDQLRTRTGLSALGMSIFEGSPLACQALLEMGAPVSPENLFDESHFSPLWASLERGKSPLVDLLLQAGADPNEKHPIYDTPIAYAAKNALLEETLILCKHGAIPNTSHPPSPLWLWIRHTVPFYDSNAGEWVFPEKNPIIALLKSGARIHVEDESEGIGMNEIELAKKLWYSAPLQGQHKQNVTMTLSLMEKNLYSNALSLHNLNEEKTFKKDRVQKM